MRNLDGAQLGNEKNICLKRILHAFHDKQRKVRIFQIVMTPSTGFLNSNLELLPNTELKLTFERAPASLSCMSIIPKSADISKDILKIKEPVAIGTYVSSPELRSFFSQIDTKPIKYSYQDVDVSIKSLPQDEKILRVDNARGGNLPEYVFFGFIKATAQTGDLSQSSTGFYLENVKSVNIVLDGKPVAGYPIRIDYNCPILAYKNFLISVDMYNNNTLGSVLSLKDYGENCIYGHKFEGDEVSAGWLSFQVELSEAFSEAYNMVIWYIYDSVITIDKYKRVEKSIL